MPFITDASNTEIITYIDNGHVEVVNVPHVVVDSAPPSTLSITETVPISGVVSLAGSSGGALEVTTPPGQPMPVSGVVSLEGFGAGTLDVNLTSASPGFTVPISGVVSLAGSSGGALEVIITGQPIQVDTELIIGETLPVSGVMYVQTSAGQPLPVSGVMHNPDLALDAGGGTYVTIWDQISRVWVTPDTDDGSDFLIGRRPGQPLPVTGVMSLSGGSIAVTDGGGSLTVDGTVTMASGANINVAGGRLDRVESFGESIMIISETLPVSGVVSISYIPPSVITYTDTVPVSGLILNTVSVSDGGGSLTVDGGVTVSTTAGNPLPVSGVILGSVSTTITNPPLVGAQWTAVPIQVRASGISVTSPALSIGTYHCVSTTACYFQQGTVSVTADANSHYLPGGQQRLILVTGTNDTYIAGIQKTAAGVIYLNKVV